MTSATPTHEQERQAILKDYPQTYFAAAAALLIVIGILIGNALFGKGGLLTANDNGYFANVFTEVASVLVTVIVIDRLNRRRDEKRDLRQLKEQLIRDVHSTSNEVAKNAVHQLRKREWLEGEDGLLKGEDLDGANLRDADLRGANLKDAGLFGADLQDAKLLEANLQGAKLWAANLKDAKLFQANLQKSVLLQSDLQGAHLQAANLQGAHLNFANLQEADMEGANLQGANLSFSNLQDAHFLISATLNEDTILPDGTKWTSDTDMTRFTDANHPNFWHSPAYRGKDAPPPAPE